MPQAGGTRTPLDRRPTAGGSRGWRRNSRRCSSPARGSSRRATRWRRSSRSGCGCGISRSASTRSTRRAPMSRSSFDELRALADAHDITRLAIETRKDQIEKLDWTIKPRRRPRRRRGGADRAAGGVLAPARWRAAVRHLAARGARRRAGARRAGARAAAQPRRRADRARCRRRRDDQGAVRRDRAAAAAAGAGL